jgi:transcriptional antiterminator
MPYHYLRTLNNNVILAQNSKNNKEVILLGKGIGLNWKGSKSTIVSSKKVDRIYELKDSKENEYITSLIKSVPSEIITITNEIIKKVEKKLNASFRPNLFLTILDHLSFAIERSKEGLESDYFYLEEMKVLLKEEYEVCVELVEYINLRLDVNLENDEAALLAIHFANARINKNKNKQAYLEKIIKEIMNIIHIKLGVDYSKYPFYEQRLKRHLRFFINHASCKSKNITGKNDGFIEIKKAISKQYIKELKCAELILEFLDKKYHLKASKEELIYLTMHIIPMRIEN